MALNKRTAVIGCAISAPVTGQERSLEEILYDVTQAALKDAGLTIEDIDGLVVAANDQMDGRAISVMAASGSVGGVDRDILSTPSAGEHAFVMGVLRIASGLYKTHIVISWSPTETAAIAEVERLAADPYFHRRLPLDDMASYALQASALAGKVPDAHESARALAGPMVPGGGAVPPAALRWPLTAAMVAAPVVGAVALVIAAEEFVAGHDGGPVAWVRGMGWATEPGFLGDRDLASAPALEAAAAHAYAEAGVVSPKSSFDVAEIANPTPYQELIALDGLGLSRRGDWRADIAAGTFAAGGTLPVNPSGGVRAANAVFCNGLIRIAEAANQVRGRAAGHQVEGVRTALAHAASGSAMQYQTVVVLGQDR